MACYRIDCRFTDLTDRDSISGFGVYLEACNLKEAEEFGRQRAASCSRPAVVERVTLWL